VWQRGRERTICTFTWSLLYSAVGQGLVDHPVRLPGGVSKGLNEEEGKEVLSQKVADEVKIQIGKKLHATVSAPLGKDVFPPFYSKRRAWSWATFLWLEGSLDTGLLLRTLNPSSSKVFTPAVKSFFFLISQLGVIVYMAFNQTSVEVNPVRNYSLIR
jgi:hypothetical protein